MLLLSKKIIGVISDFVKSDNNTILKTPFYRVRQMYVEAIKKYTKNKSIIMIIPYLEKNIEDYIKLCDGLLLVGGDDIPPEMYGEKTTLKEEQTLKIRYEFEIPFVKKYIKTNKPILGICAGMQVINVALGGTLYQDIKFISTENHGQKKDFDKPIHNINIEKNSLLYTITKKQKTNTNSMHHQAIKKLGRNLIISAKASDGIIEAVEGRKHNFCIGLQWHPEWQSSEIDNMIFKAFCKNVIGC